MSEKKYYVRLAEAFQPGGKYLVQLGFNGSDYYFDRYKGSAAENYNRTAFTKSELAEIMDGVLYRTFTHQFHPQLAEELYKLGYRTTQTTEEWIMKFLNTKKKLQEKN